MAEDRDEIETPFDEAGVEDAEDLFEAFHGYAAKEDSEDIIELDDGTVCFLVGTLTRIAYETKETDDKGLREHIHTFGETKKSARPLLYVCSDGQEIVILKGGFTFTEKGFEG